jgi:hypothetical protein
MISFLLFMSLGFSSYYDNCTVEAKVIETKEIKYYNSVMNILPVEALSAVWNGKSSLNNSFKSNY